jgi:U4/U6.U5 tri-snRNP-associated protein 1
VEDEAVPGDAPLPIAATKAWAPTAEEGERSGVVSLSVEETNRLREKLGMKPLRTNDPNRVRSASEERDLKERVENATREGGTYIEGSLRHEVHKAPENLAQKSLAEKMRLRLAERKKKREMEAKLLTTKGLGESDSDGENGTEGWVKKQKKAAREKKKAAKAAKAFEALDDEFGVGNLVEEDAKKARQKEYSSRHLRGLNVEHASEAFLDGRSVILTLKDASVLDENAGDTLVNVNIADDEKAKKTQVEAKKFKTGYNAYEGEEVDEFTGELKKRNMLDKYDEEVDGIKKDSFTIGKSGNFNEEEEKLKERERIKRKLKSKRMESLELPALRVASDYYTTEEATAKFNKVKKKKKVKRRALKADDLLPQEGDGMDALGSRKAQTQSMSAAFASGRSSGTGRGAMPMDIDDDDMKPTDLDLDDIKIDEEDDMGLEMALTKARRLKQRSKQTDNVKIDNADLILAEPKVKQEEEGLTGSEYIATFEDQQESGKLILNETVEFCRNLGSRQLNEMAERQARVKEEVAPDILEFEDSLKTRATKQHEASSSSRKKRQQKEDQKRQRGGWAEVNEDEDVDEAFNQDMDLDDDDDDDEDGAGPSGKQVKREAILDEEPDLQTGVAAAIKLATSKGYWEVEKVRKVGDNLSDLQSKNYSIDDKMMKSQDEDSRRMRDRFQGGATAPFNPDKPGFTPNVKLEYIGDDGRLLNTKEAFRHLSHKFHGKGSGKIKTEKRMKKVAEESMMKNMSSTDTPLQTLEKLKKKQKDNALPYLIMSGSQVGKNLADLRK